MDILVNIGEGLGNQVETIPMLLYLRNRCGHRVSLINMIPTYRGAEQLFRLLGFETVGSVTRQYDGQYSTFCCAMANIAVPNIPLLNRPIEPNFISANSEVAYNLHIVDDAYTDDDKRAPVELFNSVEPFADGCVDVLIHNGFNKRSISLWEAKSYPHYREVAIMLLDKAVRVASIGSSDEHVPSTINCTNLPLMHTMRLLKTCKLLIANDTGTYHLAALMGVPVICIFTFTSHIKNYDKVFHRSASIIGRDDLKCRPCQHKSPPKYWMSNKDTCRWECRDVDYRKIVEQALKVLGKI